MSSIFPPAASGGVPPGPGVCNGYSPVNTVVGGDNGARYISPDCTTILTDCQLNALTSEILAAVDKLGFPFNADRITNLGDALVARLGSIAGGGTGDVVGPAAAVDGNVAMFSGTTGKLIADAGRPAATSLLPAGNGLPGQALVTNAFGVAEWGYYIDGGNFS
jgi:hypothetical protein